MKTQLFRFILYSILASLIFLNVAIASPLPSVGNGTHFCGVIDGWANKQHSDKYPNRRYARNFAANLNVGEPRTVRLIYFLPNDRPYRADVVQKMKDEIRAVQTFFAEQMEAHGYGRATFRVETDSQGEPIVHRVDGRHPDSHYLDDTHIVLDELTLMFNFKVNIYLTVIDNSTDLIDRAWAGTGARQSKQGGSVSITGRFGWELVAHELGHAFGLSHDFRDGAYIMSYGPGENRLSQCHADFLSVHPYFNPHISIENLYDPYESTVELISPQLYSASSKSIKVRTKLHDLDGLHQVFLHARQPDNRASVKACRKLGGQREAVIAFDYDGVIPSAHDPTYSRSTSLLNPRVHPIIVEIIDTDGNRDWYHYFDLVSESAQLLTKKISGDNQHGAPNRPLLLPFVVQVWDSNEDLRIKGIPITFSVTAGGGTLSVEQTKTHWDGIAQSTLTQGPNAGTNTVLVTAAGIGEAVIFNAVAVAVASASVDIPDLHLRAAIKSSLGIAPGGTITEADMATLTSLHTGYGDISNLTGLEYATNLTTLHLVFNNIADISPVEKLTNLVSLFLPGNNIADISPVLGLTNLQSLYLDSNNISDITAVAGLTNLQSLYLDSNNISDIAAVAGLTNLQSLGLIGNNIADISPVLGLTNLQSLYLDNNNIADISPVAGLTNLEWLKLHNNPILDSSPLCQLLAENPDIDVDVEPDCEAKDPTPNLSAASPLTEAVLDGSEVTLTLADGVFKRVLSTIRSAVTISGIAGVSVGTVRRMSDTEIVIVLDFDGTDFDADATLTFSVGAGAVADYSGSSLTATRTVTAVIELASELESLAIYWIDRGTNSIRTASLNGSSNEGIVTRGLKTPKGLALDITSGQVYWTDSGTDKIQRADLDGSNIEDLVTQGLKVTSGIALDVAGGKMYWTDSGTDKIQRADLDGSNVEDLVAGGLKNPRGLALDITNGHMYWTDKDTDKIQRADLDGSNVQDLVTRGLQLTTDLALDVMGGKMYWTDVGTGKIQRANLDGSNVEDLVTGLPGPNGITLDAAGRTMYWTDWRTNKIERADLDGSNVEDVVTRGVDNPAFIAIASSALPPIVSKDPEDDPEDETEDIEFQVEDANRDGTVDVQDIVYVAEHYGQTGQSDADINGDGVVNIDDIILVAAVLDNAPAAPAIRAQLPKGLTAGTVKQWLTEAKLTGKNTPTYQHGIVMLEHLLTVLTPKETVLLAGYPNPFNAETWIPYRLAKAAKVTLEIYDTHGHTVRSIDVGFKPAAVYESRASAIYWDGRNNYGERVASGTYFYHLSTGDYSATRKMLITK